MVALTATARGLPTLGNGNSYRADNGWIWMKTALSSAKKYQVFSTWNLETAQTENVSNRRLCFYRVTKFW